MHQMKNGAQELFVSVVAPCRNAGPKLVESIDRILDILESNYKHFELIIVDDASSDETPFLLDATLRSRSGARMFRLIKSYGIDIAITAGLDSVIGDVAVVIDPLADPIEMIPHLVQECMKTGGVLYGVTERRRSLPRRWSAGVFQWYCRRYLNIDIQRNSGIFRVFSRQAVNNFIQIKDHSRLLRMMTANLGVPVKPFQYKQNGSSPYSSRQGFFEDVNAAVEIVVASSKHPLRWASRLGVLAAFLNVLYACYVVLIYLLKADVAPGWATLSLQNAAMFFMLFLVVGFLSEYIGKILVEAQGRPLYSVIEEKGGSVLLNAERRPNIVKDSPGGLLV